LDESGFLFLGTSVQEVGMNRLREARVLKRITQFRLRLETGINPSKISLGENGLVEFSEDEKQKLAKALNVPVEEIFPDPETSTEKLVSNTGRT